MSHMLHVWNIIPYIYHTFRVKCIGKYAIHPWSIWVGGVNQKVGGIFEVFWKESWKTECHNWWGGILCTKKSICIVNVNVSIRKNQAWWIFYGSFRRSTGGIWRLFYIVLSIGSNLHTRLCSTTCEANMSHANPSYLVWSYWPVDPACQTFSFYIERIMRWNPTLV